jgi:hypothetical protein
MGASGGLRDRAAVGVGLVLRDAGRPRVVGRTLGRPDHASAIAQQAVRDGHASQGELADIAAAWRAWAAADGGWFAVLHGEIVCGR